MCPDTRLKRCRSRTAASAGHPSPSMRSRREAAGPFGHSHQELVEQPALLRVIHKLLVSSPWTPSSRRLRPRNAALRLSLLWAGFARLPQDGGLPPAPPDQGPPGNPNLLPMSPDRSVTHVPGCTTRQPPPSTRLRQTSQSRSGAAAAHAETGVAPAVTEPFSAILATGGGRALLRFPLSLPSR